MAGPEFFQTRMGQTFFDHHVPRLLAALEVLGLRRDVETALTRYPVDAMARDGQMRFSGPDGGGWRAKHFQCDGMAIYVLWERPVKAP